MNLQLLLTILVLGALAPLATAQTIERKDFVHPSGFLPGVERYEKTILIGPQTSMPAIVEVTAKGNGFLSVANLHLKIVDEHDDGKIFEDGLLHVEFVDLTGNGYKDLLIFGTLDYTNEKSSALIKKEPIVQIYLFNPKAKRFDLHYQCGPNLDENS